MVCISPSTERIYNQPGEHSVLYLGDLGMEVLHILAEHLTKLAEDLFVPGVVL